MMMEKKQSKNPNTNSKNPASKATNAADEKDEPPTPVPDITDQFLYFTSDLNKGMAKPATPQILGYQLKLLAKDMTPIENDFYTCPSCKALIRDAQFTLKGTFCKACATESIKFDNTLINDKINALAAICPLSKEKVCDWKGTIGEIEDHITKYCKHVIIACSFGCTPKLIGPRVELNSHMENECPNRKFDCEHCKAICIAHDYETHLTTCPKLPLECTLECGLDIPREDMNPHVHNTCDNTEVMCPYMELGCNWQKLRKHLRGHIDEDYLYHIDITLTKFRGLNMKIQALENNNNNNNFILQ